MKSITVVYPPNCSHGIGDYLAGCLGITEWASDKNVEVHYSFQDHPISNYYIHSGVSKSDETILFCENQESRLTSFLESSEEHISIYTEWNPYTAYKPETLQKVRSILIPTPSLAEKSQAFRKSIPAKYRVVHIRLDDEQFIRCSRHADTIRKLIQSHPFEGTTVVMSNNADIKEELAKTEGWIYYDCEPVHLGMDRFMVGDVMDTCIELEILKHASEILIFSVYTWPSNFSFRISQLYSIPFTYIPIQHELIDFYVSHFGYAIEHHNDFKAIQKKAGDGT